MAHAQIEVRVLLHCCAVIRGGGRGCHLLRRLYVLPGIKRTVVTTRSRSSKASKSSVEFPQTLLLPPSFHASAFAPSPSPADISRPLSIAVEHRYAVRRLRFSPFATGVFATASYDMTVVLWDANVGQNTNDIRAGGRLYFENDAGLREGTSGREEGRQRAVRHADGFTRGLGRPCAVLARCEGHTEFVAGVAFSLFEPGLLATCAWDRRLNFWW